jgi:transcriptional regulator with XRE-family HTH domain
MRNTMPAAAPDVGDLLQARLNALGRQIRARRKALGVSAATAAEASGMSRVTLHRIERGERSVTMGAYLSAIGALGLDMELVDPQRRKNAAGRPDPLPRTLPVAEYPQLARLAWQLDRATAELTPREALDLYERNWRHVDPSAMDDRERALVDRLASEVGRGRLLV